MKPVLWLTVLALVGLPVGCKRGVDRDADDANFVHVDQADAEMNAAIAKAKSTFPQFVEALRHPRSSFRDFAVKRPYATPSGGAEHMWIADITERDGAFEGTIANDAYETALVKVGQRVRFTASEISDWKYVDGDTLVGGFTIRCFVERMAPEEKAALESEAGFKIR